MLAAAVGARRARRRWAVRGMMQPDRKRKGVPADRPRPRGRPDGKGQKSTLLRRIRLFVRLVCERSQLV